MQKKIIVLLLTLLAVGMLTAQAAPNYGAVGSGTYSITRSVTNSLFTNELDAAGTAEETPAGLGFTDLDLDYIFAGILSNPQWLTNDSSEYSSVMGGFHKGTAEMPWSIFTHFYFNSADTGTNFTETDDGSGTTEDFDAIVFDTLNFGADYIMDIGKGTTGLSLDFEFEDNRTNGANYESETSALSTDTYDKNGSTTLIEASVPFYMEQNGLNHYAVLSYEFDSTNDSEGTVYSGTNANEAVFGNYDNETIEKTSLNTIDMFYKCSFPLGGNGDNLFTAYGDLAFGFTSRKYETTNSNPLVDDSTTTFDYAPLIDFEAGAEYFMELIRSDWFVVRARPGASYHVKRDSYMKNATTGSTDAYTADGVDSTLTNTITMDFDLGMEVKPENWFLGFMVGSSAALAFEAITTEDNTAYVSNGSTADDEGTSKTAEYDWTSSTYSNFGVFIELPDDYRLDISLNTSDITEFEDFTVQLIVPLN